VSPVVCVLALVILDANHTRDLVTQLQRHCQETIGRPALWLDAQRSDIRREA